MDAMKGSREIQSPRQGLQGSNSCDILQNFALKKYFLINSESVEMTKHPNSPSLTCSPLNDISVSEPLSFSFFTPRNSFAKSGPHISRLGQEAEGFTKTTINEENEGIQSSFHDIRKSTSAPLLDPKRDSAPKHHKEEIYAKPRKSVRRANLPRRYCYSEPQIDLPQETQDQALLSAEIEDVKDQDSYASEPRGDFSSAAKEPENTSEGFELSKPVENEAKNPENTSEGFESSNPVENFHQPVTRKEENLEKNDISIEVLPGTNWSSSKPTNEETHVSDSNVEERKKTIIFMSESSAFMTGNNERRDEIKALPEDTRARYLIGLQKEEEKIMAWEKNEIAKANQHMKNFERKLQMKRIEEMGKTKKKIARIHQKAESRKVAKRTKFEGESGGVSCLAKRIRSGKLPWKWASATVCCAFVR